MPEAKDKKALSLALGAAFLNHQVEELQKSVTTKPHAGYGPKMNYARAVDPRPTRGRGQLDNSAKVVRNEPRPQSMHLEQSREREDKQAPIQVADIIVVDASLLVHGIGQLKDWCRNNRKEIVIVPLETLNTLDLLKKGTSLLAQRARAASRILEQQVGVNPRIRVQRDEAYVPWDDIQFQDGERDISELKQANGTTPEWLRRTISCARWECDHAKESLGEALLDPTVVVAICLEAAPQEANSADALPIPPKAPHQSSKYEQRCSGTLVAEWAKYSGVRVLECKPTPYALPSANNNNSRHAQAHHVHGRSASSDEEWRSTPTGSSPPRAPKATAQKVKYGSLRGKNVHGSAHGDSKRSIDLFGPGRGSGSGLVERPAATMAMASMMQTTKPIRLLARGEKLEP